MLGEYVRDQLRNALYDLQMMQKGQIAIMSETAAGDGYAERPTRVISMGDNVVQTDAEPVRYRTGKKYKQNKPLILEATFKGCIWRQAVNKLADPHLSWVKYCYAENLAFDHQLIICKEVWSRFITLENKNRGRKLSEKLQKKLQALVWLAVQVSVRSIRGPRLEYTNAELSRLTGVKPNNWQSHYLPRWALMLAVCEELDNEVIAHVGRQQKAERDLRQRSGLPV